jgi:hypothetical protein
VGEEVHAKIITLGWGKGKEGKLRGKEEQLKRRGTTMRWGSPGEVCEGVDPWDDDG